MDHELGQVGEHAATLRKILRENRAEEWTEVLEGHGVQSIADLRKVKYADLVQFGITEFEPRKRIFELIKQLNTQYPLETDRRSSLQQRMQSLARFSTDNTRREVLPENINSKNPVDERRDSLNTDYRRESFRMGEYSKNTNREDRSTQEIFGQQKEHAECGRTKKDSLDSANSTNTLRRVSVLKEGYSPGSIWKRKKELVDEIMKEAEESIILDDRSDLEENSHISTAEPDLSAEYPSIISGEERTGSISWSEPPNREMGSSKDSSRITVIVRKRPMKISSSRDSVAVVGNEVVLTESKLKVDLTPYMEPHTYTFDKAYGEYNKTLDIYRECVQGLVEYTLSGGSSTCIAYGQTGSGKTYTMLNEETGMIKLALNDLLAESVRLSFYEIYSNCIYDLLDDRKKIFAREKDGIVSIVGVKEYAVQSAEEAMQLVGQGLRCRMTGKTGANSNSSRSHALVRVRTPAGIFTFVDLAGSERGTERGTESQQTLIKREGAEINKSLLALKECIRAMDRSATHLPFRHSKLTQVLKESLVGESKCCIIATISPEEASTEHSLNTLRYAYRIRGLGAKGEAAQAHDHSQGQAKEMPRSGGSPAQAAAKNYTPATPVRERPAPVKPSPNREKLQIQQALALVASRVARERDPETLNILKEALLDIARYQKTS